MWEDKGSHSQQKCHGSCSITGHKVLCSTKDRRLWTGTLLWTVRPSTCRRKLQVCACSERLRMAILIVATTHTENCTLSWMVSFSRSSQSVFRPWLTSDEWHHVCGFTEFFQQQCHVLCVDWSKLNQSKQRGRITRFVTCVVSFSRSTLFVSGNTGLLKVPLECLLHGVCFVNLRQIPRGFTWRGSRSARLLA